MGQYATCDLHLEHDLQNYGSPSHKYHTITAPIEWVETYYMAHKSLCRIANLQ